MGATAKDTVMMEESSRTVAVVTGASRGLGRGIARAFGSKGARVYWSWSRAASCSNLSSASSARSHGRTMMWSTPAAA